MSEITAAAQVFSAIPGWPEYEVSNFGEVRRVSPACGASVGRVLRPAVMKNGYSKVSLCRNSVRHEYLVHRLVAIAFIGDPGHMDVCHFDGNKSNNQLSNLRIDTRKGNMADQIRMGKTPRGERGGGSKYKEAQVRDWRQRLDSGEAVSSLHAETGVPMPTLYGIRSRAIWGWMA